MFGGKQHNPWARKADETDEQFTSRTERMRETSRANVAKAHEARAQKRDQKPKSSDVSSVPKQAITATVSMLNGFVAMFSPADALGKMRLGEQDIDEQKMLIDAIYEQQQTSKWFRGYLGRFVSVVGGASLLGAVGLIVYVRLERRHLVPSLSGESTAEPTSPGVTPAATAPAQTTRSSSDFWTEEEWKRNHPEEVSSAVGAG